MLQFLTVSQAFWAYTPQKSPGALRAPECFIPLIIAKLLDPNLKFSRRPSRAGSRNDFRSIDVVDCLTLIFDVLVHDVLIIIVVFWSV